MKYEDLPEGSVPIASAQHLLGIYRLRLGMMEKGITHPKPIVVTGVRNLVTGLTKLDPNEKIRLVNCEKSWKFIVATTGALIAEIEFGEPDK